MDKSIGQGGVLHKVETPEIDLEITPAMVAAGVYAAREHCLGEGLEELVRKVYLAMALEA